MAKIHLLDELTANQIAAGEVIERPVSVVKELVENALDACASNINIETDGGGLTMIRVSDDGEGMSREDALLAVKRHATSKLSSIFDLDHIRTLGFRGEALPSIAAVSKMEIVTRETDRDFGTKLKLEGANLLSVEPAGAPRGTTVSVSDLFFNTPARKKFMRSPGYESGLVHELMIQFALSRPGVNFRLSNQGKEILNTNGIDALPDLIELFYGRDVKENLFYIESMLTTGTIKAYLTLPTVHRANRKGIHFFVNSRRVIAKELTIALDESYGNTLPRGRFPVAAIHLDIHPALIDVNVHPGKLEIRFRDNSIMSDLTALVKENLHDKKRSIAYFIDPPGPDSYPGTLQNRGRSQNKTSAVQESLKEFYSWGVQQSSPAKEIQRNPASRIDMVLKMPLPEEVKKTGQKTDNDITKEESGKAITDRNEVQMDETKAVETQTKLPALRVIGQLYASFILAEGEDGLYLIDQHAAHERIIFEQLMLQAAEKAVESQLLLTPLNLQLTALEEELVIENIIPLNDMGIILEHFGPRSYLLRAVPASLKDSPQDFFYSLLERFRNKNGKLSAADIRKDFLVTLSCKSAVKAGQKLSHEAQAQLIRDLSSTANALTCPHGRPTFFHIPSGDIFKAFRRQ